MGLYDLLIAPFFFFLIWLWAKGYVLKYYADDVVKASLFNRGLLMRMIGSVAFCLVYQFYYEGGDTVGYFSWTNAFRIFFLENPTKAISFLVTNNQDSFTYFIYSPGVQSSSAMPYSYLMKFGSAEVFFIKIASVINALGLFSYIGISLVFGLFSFYATWKLFIVFEKKYPHLSRELSIAILFIPSVVFWGSGLMKDTLTFGSLCMLTVAIQNGVVEQKNLLKNGLYIAVFSYLIMMLKGYIILAFLPAAAFWIFNEYKDKINNPFLRLLSVPVLLTFAALLFAFIIQQIGSSLGKFSVESIQSTALGYQQWHTIASEHGSGYTLGKVGDFSASNLVRTIPQAINVTLYRPYFTEARNVVLIMAALESFIFLIFSIYLLVKARFYKIFIIIWNDNNIQFCMLFALTFAFSVGFTSYNFGALVRYKIPCLPFFAIAMVLINDKLRTSKNNVSIKKTYTSLPNNS